MLEGLRRLVDHTHYTWQGAEKGLSLINSSRAAAPEGFADLTIRSVGRALLYRFGLIAQRDDLATFDLVWKPTGTSAQHLNEEMQSYNPQLFQRLIPWESTTCISRAIPGSLRELPCERCGGAGHVEVKCLACSRLLSEPEGDCATCGGRRVVTEPCKECREGKWECHTRRLRRVTIEQEIFHSSLWESADRLADWHTPDEGFDRLWTSARQMDVQGALTIDLSGMDAADMISISFAKLVTSIEQRQADPSVKPVRHANLRDDGVDGASTSFLNRVLNALGSPDVKSIRNERAERVLFAPTQAFVDVTPVYKVSYQRSATSFNRFLFWKSTSTETYTGTVYLSGKGQPRIYNHKETKG